MSLTGKDRKLPPYSTDLIDQLDALFPERCIREGETLEQAHRHAGKRDLINFLRQLRDEANAAALTKSISR
jgi:hypothetical protein